MFKPREGTSWNRLRTAPIDAVTYWNAPQLKTPVQIDQSITSVPLFIESLFFCLVNVLHLPPSLFTSVHLTLLILMRTKSNYQLRFTCVVDLTCRGLLSSLDGYIVVFLWGYSSVGRNHRRENGAFVVPGLLVVINWLRWLIDISVHVRIYGNTQNNQLQRKHNKVCRKLSLVSNGMIVLVIIANY